MIFAFLLVIAVYIYSALALSVIAKRAKVKNPWLAWIPFANFYLVTQIAKVSEWWTLLLLILLFPKLGVIVIWGFSIWFFWLICERRKHSGVLSLLMLIPGLGHLIVLGILAWSKK